MSSWRSGLAQNTFSLIFKNKYIIEEKQQFTERLLNSQTKLTLIYLFQLKYTSIRILWTCFTSGNQANLTEAIKLQFGSIVAGLHSFDNVPCWRSLKYVTTRFITPLLVFNKNNSQK